MKHEASDHHAARAGLEAARDKLQQKLDRYKALLDLQRHKVMTLMEVPGKEPNYILHVREPGYQIHGGDLTHRQGGNTRL